jgi:hypothetical protein
VVSSNKGKSDTPTEEDISRFLDEDERDVVSGESDDFPFSTGWGSSTVFWSVIAQM